MVTARKMPDARVEVAWSTPWRTRPAEGDWSRIDLDRVVALDMVGGITGYASTPDTAALDLTGDLDIRALVALDDWTPAALAGILTKQATPTSSTDGYSLIVQPSGVLALTWGNGAAVTRESTVAPTVANGAALWVRATLDADNGAGGHTVTFYTSDDHIDTPMDDVVWTQLGTPVVTGGTTTISANTTIMRVGASGSLGSAFLAGWVACVQLRSSIGGTVVAQPDWRNENITTGEPDDMTDTIGLVWNAGAGTNLIDVGEGLDVFAPLRALDVARGARLKVAEVEAGTANGTFDNRSRVLDPTNASSPWYPNVKPRRRIRYILEPEGEDEVTVHTGFIERLPLAWEVGDHTVAITSTDLLALLAEEALPPSVLHQTHVDLGAELYWPMSEEGGTVMEDVIGQRDGAYRIPTEGGNDVVPYAKGGASFAVYSADNRKVPQATLPGGLLDLPSAFSISTWYQSTANYSLSVTGAVYDNLLFQQDGFITDGLASSVANYMQLIVITDGTFRGNPRFYIGDAGGDFRDFLPDEGTVDLLDGKPHHIVVTNTGSLLTIYVDGVALTQGGGVLDVGSWPSYPVGTTTLLGQNSNTEYTAWDSASTEASTWRQAHTAVWFSALTAEEVATLYSAGVDAWSGDRTGERLARILDIIGVDADDRDIATGTQVCGGTFLGGTFADYLARIVSTEQGACYVDGDGHIVFTERPENDPTPLLTLAGSADDGVPYADISPDYSLDRILNVVEVTREGGLPQRSTNDDSVTEWGTASTDLSTLNLSASGARSVGARITIRNGDPRLVFDGAELAMRRDDVPLSLADVAIGQALTVEAKPTADGDTISQLSLVERMDMALDWQGEKDWRVTLGLTEHVVLPCLSWDTPGQGWSESVWCDG